MTETLKLRHMQSGDLDAVRGLLGQLGYAVAAAELEGRFATVAGAEGHELFVARQRGRLAGFLHVFARPALEKPPEAIVQSLVVEERLRGSGVGRALMQAAETWATEKGFASLALSSRLDRADAHAFYAALGYGKVAESGLLRKKIPNTPE